MLIKLNIDINCNSCKLLKCIYCNDIFFVYFKFWKMSNSIYNWGIYFNIWFFISCIVNCSLSSYLSLPLSVNQTTLKVHLPQVFFYLVRTSGHFFCFVFVQKWYFILCERCKNIPCDKYLKPNSFLSISSFYEKNYPWKFVWNLNNQHFIPWMIIENDHLPSANFSTFKLLNIRNS